MKRAKKANAQRRREDVIGAALITQVFGRKGPLTDPAAQKASKEGTRALLARRLRDVP